MQRWHVILMVLAIIQFATPPWRFRLLAALIIALPFVS